MTGDPLASHQSYREQLPKPELAHVVSCVWVQQVAAGRAAYEHRSAPNGCAEISGVVGGGALSVSGPRQGPIVEQLPPGTIALGIRFRPGAAHAVLGVPASELVDRRVGLERLWGRAAVVLAERIAEAATPGAAARILEDAVAVRVTDAPAPDPLVAAAIGRLQPWRPARVGDVTSELHISARQLRRRFADALGYGPKALQRILRLQAFLALTQQRGTRHVALSRLAADVGYADQAHMTRECLRLTGLAPTALLAEMRATCGPTHDHAASFAPLRHALLGAGAR